ncbi:MAG: hypothetical protein Q8J96_05365, partial [Rhodocyclaceae bacterium]|nr:hypothetical protein [Rhodocyclaceae bacterium]
PASALSGGNNRATVLFLNASPYRAIVRPYRPQVQDHIGATTILTRGALPAPRCLSKEQAAVYLGIGVTLLAELRVPAIKLGRRCVYDVLDLDAWLNEYKQRGRAGKEKSLWPTMKESTEGRTHAIGGLQQPSQTAEKYAKALGLKTERMPRRYSQRSG